MIFAPGSNDVIAVRDDKNYIKVEKLMERKHKNIIVILCISLLMATSCSNKKNPQETEEKQDDTINILMGNSPANHANGGMVCGKEEEIYFSDRNENGYLYKMLPDGSEKELIVEEPCCNINIIDNYIYYQSEKDYSIRTYCISNGKIDTLVGDPVEDMVVTSEAVYFISNTIEKIGLDGKGRMPLMQEGEYFYLDICGEDLFYTRMEDGVNLYTVSKDGENLHLLLEGAKGAVVIEDRIFYTGIEDNLLYCYDKKEQTKAMIDVGYNANVWGENIYYIKDNCLWCYANGEYTVVLQDYFEEIANDYNLEAYYIVNDHMFIVFSVYNDEIGYEQMIALELSSDDIVLE